MYQTRKACYEELEHSRESKVIAYVTGDRRNMEAKVASEILDHFVHHLDTIGVVERISLVLYTRGGDTLAAWSLANLLRTFCDEFEVIVPSKAHSAGTLIALGAERIVMTKQATLGPIDPSVSGPLNPPIPGAPPNTVVPVSVENVTGFLDFAKDTLEEGADLGAAFLHLADTIHPMVLGQAFRARAQIRRLAEKLLRNHMSDAAKIDEILAFLCSESGSHDYTVNRREAKKDLGLPVVKPSQELYEVIKKLYDDVAEELELRTPYDPAIVLGGKAQAKYRVPRALIESVDGGSHQFVSEGTLLVQQIQGQKGVVQNAVNDARQFEGWRHINA